MLIMKSITYSEFKESVRSSSLDVNNLISYYEPVAKFYYGKSQGEPYCITDFDFNNDSSLSRILDSFGIYTTELIENDYNKILFVDPARDLKVQYDEQTSKISDVPNFIVILSEDSDVIGKVIGEYEALGLSFEPMQVFEDKDLYERNRERISEKISSERLLDITDACVRMSLNKETYYDKIVWFDKFIDELHAKIHEDPKLTRVPVCLGSSSLSPYLAKIATELFTRYGDRSYCDDNYVSLVTKEYSRSCLSPNDCYKHDLFKALTHLPKVLIRKDLVGDIYNLIDRQNSKFRVRLTYTDSSMEDSPKTEYFDIRRLTCLDIVKEWDLNSESGCASAKSKIMRLYDALGLNDRGVVLSVVDLVLFEMDGDVKIGYVEDISVELKALTYINGISEYSDVTIKFEELTNYVGPGIYLNYRKALIPFAKVLGPKPRVNIISPKRKLLEYLRNSAIPVSAIVKLYEDGVVDLSTLGLACRVDSLSRSSFNKSLANAKGLNYVRENADCFGGFNPVLIKYLNA